MPSGKSSSSLGISKFRVDDREGACSIEQHFKKKKEVEKEDRAREGHAKEEN